MRGCFADMIEKTIYSVSNDETRYYLNGVFFERINKDAENQLSAWSRLTASVFRSLIAK
jgi:DNA polymerase III sliding clamp (beta) subunit (PCNA family)